MTHKGRRSHTALQRGIDPHVDDPDHCHVSARSPVMARIAESVLGPLRGT